MHKREESDVTNCFTKREIVFFLFWRDEDDDDALAVFKHRVHFVFVLYIYVQSVRITFIMPKHVIVDLIA